MGLLSGLVQSQGVAGARGVSSLRAPGERKASRMACSAWTPLPSGACTCPIVERPLALLYPSLPIAPLTWRLPSGGVSPTVEPAGAVGLSRSLPGWQLCSRGAERKEHWALSLGSV